MLLHFCILWYRNAGNSVPSGGTYRTNSIKLTSRLRFSSYRIIWTTWTLREEYPGQPFATCLERSDNERLLLHKTPKNYSFNDRSNCTLKSPSSNAGSIRWQSYRRLRQTVADYVYTRLVLRRVATTRLRVLPRIQGAADEKSSRIFGLH